MYEAGAKSYQQANYMTADPLRLIIMCYDGAIKHLKTARESYEKKDYQTKGVALKKAVDIINELNSCLDMQKGGEIASRLRSLYNFMSQALMEADLKKDLKVFDSVISQLNELAESWRTIAGQRPEAPEQSAPVNGISQTAGYVAASPLPGRNWSV